MEVILLERIEKLGAIGDVVNVKPGFARNFLLPNGKALRANDANRKVFEANREKIEATNAERRATAETDSKGLDGVSIQLIRQASNTGQLYGSVSARDLSEALEAQGHKVAKNQIVLDKPIKAIGVQDVRVALHPEVSVTIKVNVARSPEEAELQAKGVDVMADMFEKDSAGFTEDFDPNAEPGATAEAQASDEAGETDEAAAAEDTAEAAEPAEASADEDAAASDSSDAGDEDAAESDSSDAGDEDEATKA
jgi:large subunit ribosomal protein L9